MTSLKSESQDWLGLRAAVLYLVPISFTLPREVVQARELLIAVEMNRVATLQPGKLPVIPHPARR
jgi:hypothetical protein